MGTARELSATGKRYDNLANTKSMGGYALFNFSANWHMNRDTTLDLRLNNAFDKHYELAAGYNTAGRNMFVGLNYQPH